MKIGEILDRRTDLSTFVVHLTRDGDGMSAKERLESIVEMGRLTAGSPMGWAQSCADAPHLDVAGAPQLAVSFSETPLENIYSMFAEIDGRSVNLQPYGLAFTKMAARRKGGNPIWYVDRTAGADHQWATAMAIDELAKEALKSGSDEVRSRIGKLLPFFEVMGSWPQGQKEFWWEREWRHVGDMEFDASDVALWLCPESDVEHFENLLQGGGRVVDPSWSLERIVASLAGQKHEDVTPFSTR
jgi:hypothetical protein